MDFDEKKNHLFDFLAAIGVESIRIECWGSGDEGQIEDITVEPEDVHSKALKTKYSYYRNGNTEPLSRVLDDFAWDVFEVTDRSGWYDGEGGYCHLDIKVPERKIAIEHGAAYTEYEVEEEEI